MRTLIAATMLLCAAGAAGAAGSLAVEEAGLALPAVQVPAPEARKGNQWHTLRKIQLNTAQPGMNDGLIGMVDHGVRIDVVLAELNAAGFAAVALSDNQGGYMVYADVKGRDAADLAVGLARYYYITQVLVGQQVYDRIFAPSGRSAYAVSVKGGRD